MTGVNVIFFIPVNDVQQYICSVSSSSVDETGMWIQQQLLVTTVSCHRNNWLFFTFF